MMKREFLSYQAPLYRRATAQIHLQPLSFGLTLPFFSHYSAVDRVAIYAMFGGIRAYWERIDPGKSISKNIKIQLLTSNNLMQSEPVLLLHDFVSDLHNYVAILTAIANGARTPKEIASMAGLPNLHVPKYLSVLAEITRHLIDFIGAHTWEELCREWVLRAGALGHLPFMPDEVGSAWNRSA